MNYLARIGLILLLFLSIGIGATAQTREEFVEIEQGFRASKAIEEDGTRSVLVLFPDKYLETPQAFAEGTLVVLPLLMGCEPFPECKPSLSMDHEDKTGLAIFIDTILPRFKIAIRGLVDNKKPVGIIIQVVEIKGGKLTR